MNMFYLCNLQLILIHCNVRQYIYSTTAIAPDYTNK